jgi:hypothetical protein
MKYFGIFNPDTLELSDLEIENLMLEKGLLEKIVTTNPGVIKEGALNFTITDNIIEIVPTKEHNDEYYDFIIDLYNLEIKAIKLPILSKFNDAIFGLEQNEQKVIALQCFKKIYNTIYKEVLTIQEEKMNDDGVFHTHNYNKLKMLYFQWQANKNNLASTRTSLHYLVGDKNTYIESNFIENEIVQEVLFFEAQKQVLVELNSRFGFEDDYYFTNKLQDNISYKKYDFIFKSLKAYQFTNAKIRSFKYDEKAYSVSLYQVLLNHDLIVSKKSKFKEFMNSEYGFFPAEILTYEEKINRAHDERVKQFSEDWIAFSSKK